MEDMQSRYNRYIDTITQGRPQSSIVEEPHIRLTTLAEIDFELEGQL